MTTDLNELKLPELDRLSEATPQYNAIMEFLEEFLPGEDMVLHKMSSGLTDLRVCYGPRGGMMDDCPGPSCPKCGGEGVIEISIEDRYVPYSASKQDLVYRFLGIDGAKVEAERRTLLDAIRAAS